MGITAGLNPHPQMPDPSAIQSVTLTTPVMRYANRPHPDTGLAGKFSLRYRFTSGLPRGGVKIDTFADDEAARPDMEALPGKITMNMSPDMPPRFDKMWVEASIEMRDGGLSQTCRDGPRGIRGSPPISDEDRLVKVWDCLSRRLPTDRADRLIGLARRAETLTSAELRALLRETVP